MFLGIMLRVRYLLMHNDMLVIKMIIDEVLKSNILQFKVSLN